MSQQKWLTVDVWGAAFRGCLGWEWAGGWVGAPILHWFENNSCVTHFHWKHIQKNCIFAKNVEIVDVANKRDPNLASEALDAIFGILAQNHAEWYHRDLPNRSGSLFPSNQPKCGRTCDKLSTQEKLETPNDNFIINNFRVNRNNNFVVTNGSNNSDLPRVASTPGDFLDGPG